MKKALIVLAILFVGLCGLGSCAAALTAGLAAGDSTTVSTAKPSPTVAKPPVVETPAPAPKTEAPKATVPAPDSIADGMYVVGTDFPAGRYRSPGATPSDFAMCSVTIEDASGKIDDMEISNAADQSIMFTATDGQTVSIDGCQPFTKL